MKNQSVLYDAPKDDQQQARTHIEAFYYLKPLETKKRGDKIWSPLASPGFLVVVFGVDFGVEQAAVASAMCVRVFVFCH